jgi:hypothetical protein
MMKLWIMGKIVIRTSKTEGNNVCKVHEALGTFGAYVGNTRQV